MPSFFFGFFAFTIKALALFIVCHVLAQLHQFLPNDGALLFDIPLKNLTFFELPEDQRIFLRLVTLPVSGAPVTRV
jgi:hypothetical protein